MNTKFLIQCGLCIIFLLLISIFSYLGNEKINNAMSKVLSAMSQNTTVGDVKETADRVATSAKNILNSPLDKKEDTQEVYAQRGGDVIKTGYCKGQGMIVVIKHPDNSISRYSNLDKVVVLPEERVSKGKIIGTCGQNGGNFSYELIDKDV